MLGDLVTEGAQALGQLGGGLRFVRRQLRMLVQIKIEIVGGRVDCINLFGVGTG